MATRGNPEEVVADALEDRDETLVPLGEYAARDDDNEVKTSYPAHARRANNVDGDTTFRKYYHPETGATVTIPIDE